MSNNTVELLSFTKKYASKFVFKEVDFFAKSNSITGLLGPNGAGKSTILKTISGVIYPTDGTVKVCGFDDPAEIRKITGYVPEHPELEGNLTVKETLLLESGLYCSGSDIESNVGFAVDFTGLNEVLNVKVKTLSKGFAQRLSLAKALCIDPKILILDEFSAGLDPKQIVELRNKIKKLSKKITVIFSTHHIEEASSLCDEIYIIDKGIVKSHGTVDEIIKVSGAKNLEDAYLKFIEGTGEDKA